MTRLDYADAWRRYWEEIHDGSRRLLVENAAATPDAHWLVADLGELEDEFDVDPADAQRNPDVFLDGAVAGFEAFVDADAVEATPDPDGYGTLPVHLTGLDRVDGGGDELDDPVADANRLVQVRNATVTGEVESSVRAVRVAYRCPRGHETTIEPPRHRPWTLNTCGVGGCQNEVVADDARTRARRVVDFAIDFDGEILPCTAGGRYASAAGQRDRLVNADRLLLAGIPRLVVDADGTTQSTFEVVHAEPT